MKVDKEELIKAITENDHAEKFSDLRKFITDV